MGTSGQTIDDIYQYLEDNDRLGMARHTLEWNHLAPTAPDTLCAFRKHSTKTETQYHSNNS